MGSACSKRRVEHHYCDRCGEEEELIDVDGEELCAKCARKELGLAEEDIACMYCEDGECRLNDHLCLGTIDEMNNCPTWDD